MADSPDVAEIALLEAEAMERRKRLGANLDRLSVEMKPRRLLHNGMTHARHRAREEAERAKTAMSDLMSDMMTDSKAFAKDNGALLLAGAALAIGAGIGLRAATRRKPVPIYEAWNMDEAAGQDDDQPRSSTQAAMRAARERMAKLGGTAHDATEAARLRAREAAIAARQSAGEAGRWADRQRQDHPYALILGGLALGAAVGLLTPRSDGDGESLTGSADGIGDAVRARLAENGITAESLHEQFDEMVSAARRFIHDITDAVSNQISRVTK